MSAQQAKAKCDRCRPLREELLAFALEMEKVFRANSHKGPTRDGVDLQFAVERLFQEVRELDRGAYSHVSILTTHEELEEIRHETVDVANFAALGWIGLRECRGASVVKEPKACEHVFTDYQCDKCGAGKPMEKCGAIEPGSTSRCTIHKGHDKRHWAEASEGRPEVFWPGEEKP
jgi:hypothetical protein